MALKGPGPANAGDDLDAIPGTGVGDGASDNGLELLLGEVRSHFGSGFARGCRESGKTLAEAGLESFDFGAGGHFAIRGGVVLGDEADAASGVVEDEDGVADEEKGVFKPEGIGVVVRELFETADEIIGEDADGSSDEAWAVGEDFAGESGGEGLEEVESVFAIGEGVLAGFGSLADGGIALAGTEDGAWADADERVASELFTAGDAFEEKGIGFVVGEFPVGTQRGFEIGGEISDDH